MRDEQEYYKEHKDRISKQRSDRLKGMTAAQKKAKALKAKLYYEENREAVLTQKKAYSKANKAARNALAAKRRALRRDQTPNLTEDEAIRIGMLYKITMGIKRNTGVGLVVDHILPLSKGGLHHPLNLQILTANENNVKHSTIPETLSSELVKLHNEFYGYERYTTKGEA